MPNHRTHLLTGLASAVLLAYILKQYNAHLVQTIPHLLLCICFALAGSIFPDIDIDSKMQRMFWPAITIILLLTLFTAQFHLFIILTVITFFITLIGHRTITHEFWFVMSFPCALAWYLTTQRKLTPFVYVCALFFIVGACSHIFLDRTMSKLKRHFRR